MKKLWKRSLLLVIVLATVFCLSGCSALETMRSSQAVFDVDKNIQWNSHTYKLLPECDFLYPDTDYQSHIYLTDTDVPVLLSPFFYHDELLLANDETLLVQMYESGCYCRADLYDELCARIREPFSPDLVCYSYEVYDPATDAYITEYYTLTDEQTALLRSITETEKATPLNNWDKNYDWELWVEECSEDMLLRRNTLDIVSCGDTYYLFLYTDADTFVFEVPEGCNEAFDDITKAYTTTLIFGFPVGV